jgi:hypothetical protein
VSPVMLKLNIRPITVKIFVEDGIPLCIVVINR